MSTSISGEAKRSLIIGTRLWPPARTLASPPPSASRAHGLLDRPGSLVAESRGVDVCLLGFASGLRPEFVLRLGLTCGTIEGRARPRAGIRPMGRVLAVDGEARGPGPVGRRLSGSRLSPATPRSWGSYPSWGPARSTRTTVDCPGYDRTSRLPRFTSRISWANRLQTDGRTSRCTKDSGCTGILPARNLTHSATLASAFLAITL